MRRWRPLCGGKGVSDGRGAGGGRTDGVEDEHEGDVVDDGVVERRVTASTRISPAGHAHAAAGTLARAGWGRRSTLCPAQSPYNQTRQSGWRARSLRRRGRRCYSRLGLRSRWAVNERIVVVRKAYRYLPTTTANECRAGNARGVRTNIRSTIPTKQKKGPGVAGAAIVGIRYTFLLIVGTWGSTDCNACRNLKAGHGWEVLRQKSEVPSPVEST